MSIHVTDFKYEKGKNEVKYIELLEKTLKNEQRVTALAVAKVRKLAKENQEIRAKAIDEFAEVVEINIIDMFVSESESGMAVGILKAIAEQLKGGTE